MLHKSSSILLVAIVLSSCFSQPKIFEPKEYVIQGVISSIPLRLDLPATHKLTTNGSLEYLLSSSSVQLRSYEDKKVRLSGTSINTNNVKDSPLILQVDSIVESIVEFSSSSLDEQTSSTASSALSSVTTSSSSLQSSPGKPCGGVAGILCPAGQYCTIIDIQTNSGRCNTL